MRENAIHKQIVLEEKDGTPEQRDQINLLISIDRVTGEMAQEIIKRFPDNPDEMLECLFAVHEKAAGGIVKILQDMGKLEQDYTIQ